MAEGTGFATSLGIGFESTYGTAVARTNWVQVARFNPYKRLNRNPREVLGQRGAGSRNHRSQYDGLEECGFGFAFPANFNDTTLAVFRAALWANATTGSGPYTHTMNLSTTEPAGLTVEAIEGDFASGSNAEVYEGVVIDTLRIVGREGKELMIEADCMAETSGGYTSAGTPSYNTTPYPILHHQAGAAAFTWQSVSVPIRNFTTTLRHNLARRPQYGSKQTLRPKGGRTEVMLDIELEFESAANGNYYGEFLSQASGDATLTFSDSPRSLALTWQNLEIIDYSKPVDGPGVIIHRLQARALSDGTDEGFKAVFVNANSTVTTN